jgi:hypothetical protein
MRSTVRTLSLLLAALVISTGASAAGLNRVHLVPALKPCPGFGICPGRQLASRYTFDSMVLRTPASRYLPPDKPTLLLQIRGVRDASGAPVDGELTLKVLSGRVYTPPAGGTLGDDSSLAVQPPVAVPLRNGSNPKFAYRPPQATPPGTLVNGGGVEVYDPEGNLLAVTGSQAKP